MKTVRTAALIVVMAGTLLMRGPAPQAIGQSPGASIAPAGIKSGYFGESNSQSHTFQLAKQYAKATKEEERKEIKKQMTDSLIKEFDQLAQRQEAELDDLEKHVADLKALLKKRKDSKDTIVERRLEQLIQEAEGLGWGSPKRADPTSPFSYTKPNNFSAPEPQRK